MDTKEKQNQIVSRIVEALNNPNLNWQKTWECLAKHATNAKTHDVYRGINTLVLGLTMAEKGYSENLWATFKQWKELGGNVRKGEKGTKACFYSKKAITETEKDSDGNEQEKTVYIPFIKIFTVFNLDQVEGIEMQKPETTVRPIENIDHMIENLGVNIRQAGNQPCYIPAIDTIEMPKPGKFYDTEQNSAEANYYATLLHEAIHSTGHESRLNRFAKNPFEGNSKSSYAFEELIAEIGSVFACTEFGIASEISENNLAYLKGWVNHLANNDQANLIIRAASYANQAVQYIIDPANAASENQNQQVA